MTDSAGFVTSVRRPSQTKIVATVGPACDDPAMLARLMTAGVDVFRLNSAHGGIDDLERRADAIRKAAGASHQVVAILVDLAGPKMRLGELRGGELSCVPGGVVRFVRGDVAGAGAGADNELVCTYEALLDELQPTDRIMLADGTVALTVESIDERGAVCRVQQGGTVRSRQGVNLPGVKLKATALSAQDRAVAEWGARAGVDFISLSFVRTAAEVRELRKLIRASGGESQIVAKIEKPEAIDNLTEIVAEADAVMVARGDLGVESDIARIAVVQKQIVDACRRARKPVIIATQMLDSMHHSRLPTRAEATDVANAVLDGADACMLSGETAIGKYPVESVEMMHRIALATESLARTPRIPEVNAVGGGVSPITEATTRAAGWMARELDAKLIIVASTTGQSALGISQTRTFVPTIGVSDSATTLRRMCLYWGVVPVPGAPVGDDDQLLQFVIERGRAEGELASGDRLVLLTGTGLPASPHNAIIVHQLP